MTRAILLSVLLLSLAETQALACQSISPEVEERIRDGHRRDRLRAHVVVRGSFTETNPCSGDVPCRGWIKTESVLRGVKLVEYPIQYSDTFDMCDWRTFTPESGAYGKFYLQRTFDGDYAIVEFNRSKSSR